METAATGVIRPKSSKSKTVAENVGLAAFTKSAPIIDIAPRIRAKRQAKPLLERIERLTRKDGGADGVWTWLGSIHQGNGYPQISYTDPYTGKYTTKPVARVLMEQKLGRRLDRKEYVLHQRGVPKTDVNPAHLRIGSQQENMDDAVAEGRMRGKLSVAQVLKIDMLFHKQHVEIAAIACRFGVSHPTVRNIVIGKTHSDKTGRVYVPGKPGRPAKKLLTVEKSKSRTLEAVD